jgi:hypothetical protein
VSAVPRLPYLASAALHAERAIMVDTCSITRDVEGVLDDTLNLTTGTLTAPAPDASSVYTGACLVSPATTMEKTDESAGKIIPSRRYGVRIPTTAPTVRPGDLIEITERERDASLIGRVLRVESITRQSLAVTRQLVVVEVDQSS